MSIAVTFNWVIRCDHCGTHADLGTYATMATLHDRSFQAKVEAIGWQTKRLESIRGTGHLCPNCQSKRREA